MQFADLEAIDLGSQDHRGANRTNGTEGDRMIKPAGEGAYVIYTSHIAFRDNHDSKWRVSKIDVIGTNVMQLTPIGEEFGHLWQVEEFITHLAEIGHLNRFRAMST